jgi:hypothetical protein
LGAAVPPWLRVLKPTDHPSAASVIAADPGWTADKAAANISRFHLVAALAVVVRELVASVTCVPEESTKWRKRNEYAVNIDRFSKQSFINPEYPLLTQKQMTAYKAHHKITEGEQLRKWETVRGGNSESSVFLVALNVYISMERTSLTYLHHSCNNTIETYISKE